MRFEKITLKTRALMDHYLEGNPLFEHDFSSELNFQNLYVWKDTEEIEVLEVLDRFLIIRCVHGGMICYFPPVARTWEMFFSALRMIEASCVDKNIPFVVRALTEEMVEAIQKSDLKYRITEDRDLFEYLYSSESLRTLSGKALHNKRNLFNQFVRHYSYVFKPYEPADLPLVMELLSDWEEQKRHAFEHDAILDTLSNLEAVGCFADLLVVGGKAVAFSIGAKNAKMGLVLFEKADTAYTGVYAAINTLFANRHFADVRIVNRQEDIGIAELRKAKLSYDPIGFAKKYTATRNHITLEEVAELKALYHEAFDDSEGFLNYFFGQKYRAENVMFRKVDHKIVSALHFIPKTLSVRGALMRCPFVVAAATLKSFRGQGIMHSLIGQAFVELYNRDISLVGLSPFSETFYAETGFVTVNRAQTVRLDIPRSGRYSYQTIGPDDLAPLGEIYQEKMKGYDIFVERSQDYWKGFWGEVSSDDGKIILVAENDAFIGYFTLFEDSSEEICFPDESRIATVDLLDGKKIRLTDGEGQESHAMIRIVNVRKLLTEFPFPADFQAVRRIRITDAFFEPNNLTLEITVKNGQVFLRDIEEHDEELTIETLTKQMFVEGSDLFPRPKVLIFDKY